VPGAVSAKLTEATLPPLIAARTAELLEPARAVDMVRRISDRYLADVSAVMDAARAPSVVAAIPADRVATIGAELARRKEWVVIGGFVSYISEDGLRASIAEYNGEQLLRVGYVLEDVSRLDDIGALLTEAQIDQMLSAAASFDLWAELADLLENLEPPRVTRMRERYAAVPVRVSAAFEAAAAEGSLPAATLAALTG
jgi:hypothetical protein